MFNTVAAGTRSTKGIEATIDKGSRESIDACQISNAILFGLFFSLRGFSELLEMFSKYAARKRCNLSKIS